MHAIKLTGINYGVLTESEWEGRRSVKLSPKIPGVFIRKADLEIGFDKDGRQVRTLAVRITADTSAVDALLSRAGWKQEPDIESPYLHYLSTISHEKKH